MVNYVQLSWNNGKWCLTECQKNGKVCTGCHKIDGEICTLCHVLSESKDNIKLCTGFLEYRFLEYR